MLQKVNKDSKGETCQQINPNLELKFEVELEKIVQFIDETAQLLQIGAQAPSKVVKIDLDKISSGSCPSDSDDSCSNDSENNCDVLNESDTCINYS